MCITPEVKLCVGLRNQDRAMATAQNPTKIMIVKVIVAKIMIMIMIVIIT